LEVGLDLAEALNDIDQEVRNSALSALARCDPVPPAALEPLLAALNWEANLNQRCEVAVALTQIGPAAWPILRAALFSPDRATRRCVLFALGSAAQLALLKKLKFARWDGAVTDLAACLEDGSAAVRRDAARILGRMGAEARQATPALILATRDPCKSSRCHALAALRAIGDLPAEATPALVERLSDPVSRVRLKAVKALGDMGERAAVAVVPLAGALDDPNCHVVMAVLDALGRLGSVAAEAVPALQQFGGRSRRSTRRRVCLALDRIEADLCNSS
jgi:HEAT repeat protein